MASTIRHEPDACEAEDHHGPGGGFGDARCDGVRIKGRYIGQSQVDMGIHQATARRKSGVGIDQPDGDRRSVDAELIIFRLEAELGDEVESVEGAILECLAKSGR
jgi:hypothetical protein